MAGCSAAARDKFPRRDFPWNAPATVCSRHAVGRGAGHTHASALPRLHVVRAAAALPAQDNVRIVKVPDQRAPARTATARTCCSRSRSAQHPRRVLARQRLPTAQDRLPLQDVGQRRSRRTSRIARLFDLLACRPRPRLAVRICALPSAHGAEPRHRVGRAMRRTTARSVASCARTASRTRTRGTRRPRLARPRDARTARPAGCGRAPVRGAGPARGRRAAARPAAPRISSGCSTSMPRMRERLLAADVFEVELRLGPASTLFEFQCVPARLDLAGSGDHVRAAAAQEAVRSGQPQTGSRSASTTSRGAACCSSSSPPTARSSCPNSSRTSATVSSSRSRVRATYCRCRSS
jgi:hypothetical protein